MHIRMGHVSYTQTNESFLIYTHVSHEYKNESCLIYLHEWVMSHVMSHVLHNALDNVVLVRQRDKIYIGLFCHICRSLLSYVCRSLLSFVHVTWPEWIGYGVGGWLVHEIWPKETYTYDKRDLYIWQKRPSHNQNWFGYGVGGWLGMKHDKRNL